MTDLEKAIAAARAALKVKSHPLDSRVTKTLRDLLAALDAARGQAVAFLYTLEHGASVVARKASTYRLNYPFGGGDDYRPSEDGLSYVRETPLYAAPPATERKGEQP